MSSSSEDDVPLAARAAQVVKPTSNGAAAPTSNGAARNHKQPTPSSSRPASGDDSSDDEASSAESESEPSSSDSDDDVPLSQRNKKSPKKPAAKQQPVKRKREAPSSSAAAKRTKREGSKGASKGGPKWSTLLHCGVLFPPEYEPHGVKMLYEGKPVELTPEQEEVASMFAIMKETDYMQKPIFLKNFWEGFREVRLGFGGGGCRGEGWQGRGDAADWVMVRRVWQMGIDRKGVVYE
jgi:DNA topoisomerase-1